MILSFLFLFKNIFIQFGISLDVPAVKSGSKKSPEQAMESSNRKNTSAVHPHNPERSDKLPVKVK